MAQPPEPQIDTLLRRSLHHALDYLDGMPERHIPAIKDTDDLRAAFGGPLPQGPSDPVAVLDELVTAAEPGLAALGSPRFFGFVIGGAFPVSIAADWLTSAWDQNVGLREVTPAHSAAREAVQAWVLDLLGLPATATVGTVTGGMMANFTGLTAGRHAVLARSGWDVEERGLQGAPPVTVLVGEERHSTIDLALRYLGLGAPTLVPADHQGRIRVDALADALAASGGPTLVALQAGEIHSGAFDDFAAAIPLAHEHGAWVHIDGAFGLWAGAAPATAHLVRGYELADSWATDAHKTLNVPYDSGLAIVADQLAHRAAFGVHAPYLIQSDGAPDPFELTPEFSQRGRAFVLWATLRALGRSGVSDLVEGLHNSAVLLADGVRALGGEVLNDVVFTQVSTAWGSDEATAAVEQALVADGETWMTGSTWQGRRVLRIAVSNWATDAEQVRRALAALDRARSGL
ncbi:MAG: pyridoxal-dependent decarboxylase [Candidatus Nanopelagicales bacterium]